MIPNPSVVSSLVVSWRDPIRLPAFCSALRVFYISVFSHFHHDLLRFVLPIFYRLLLTDVNLLRIVENGIRDLQVAHVALSVHIAMLEKQVKAMMHYCFRGAQNI